MILVIDNYDSFTFNLVQYIGELGGECRVARNNEITLKQAIDLNPSHIVISPGPGRPKDAGVSLEMIKYFSEKIPIFGVCLGHQCLAEAFGGNVDNAEILMHGKISDVYHTGDGLFLGVPSPFEATRYHSLIVREESLPDCLHVIAHTDDGEIMAIRHSDKPVVGVQFHPESILTTHGKNILSNFLSAR